jgi:branched-subunit amino acid ABC-type transport system permease component
MVYITRVYIENSLLFSNTLVMMAVGLTLTYLTTKVPNFAHGSLAMVGAYSLFTIAAIIYGKQLNQYQLGTPSKEYFCFIC